MTEGAQTNPVQSDSEKAKGDSGPDGYYILSSSYAYRGPCGGEGAGLENVYRDQLEALESQLGWLLGFDENHFDAGDYLRARKELETAIAAIQESGTDANVSAAWLSIGGFNVGYSTLASGYWTEFAPQAVSALEDELRDAIHDLASDAGEEETISALSEELAQVQALGERQDVNSDSYVSELFDLLGAYGERHA